MIYRCLVFVLSSMLLLGPSTALSQPQVFLPTPVTSPPVKSRPKIGLVLSGGGARGLAHIGVLLWFEEHRIPVDYIAGTSMGGLMAGMYAMGMSSNEMQEFVNQLDWDAVLSSPPRYDELSYRRKEDQRTYPSEEKLHLGLWRRRDHLLEDSGTTRAVHSGRPVSPGRVRPG